MKGKLYFDGASEPNPGNSGIGVVIIKGKKRFFSLGENIGFHTNNEAEFIALQRGLEKAIELGFTFLECFGDSKLVICAMRKQWKLSKINLLRIKTEIDELLKKINAKFVWIPRQHNTKADFYSKEGLSLQPKVTKQNLHQTPKSPQKTILRRRNGIETRIT